MKKLVSLLLILSMLMGCAALAEDKPYKGKNIDLCGWAFNFDELLDADGNIKDPSDERWYVYAAVLEWCAENECSFTFRGHPSNDELQAAVSAGNAPDLLYTYDGFPIWPITGLTQALPADRVTEMKAKYDTKNFDLLDYAGQNYGVEAHWQARHMVKYDRTLLEEYGITTPRQYYEDGNWNYETYKQFRKDCTFDADGDGVVDYGGGYFGSYTGQIEIVKFNEDGSLTSQINTEHIRAWYQMAYETLAIDNTRPGGDGSKWFQLDEHKVYAPATMGRNSGFYFLNGVFQENTNGHVLEIAPYPAWNNDYSQEKVNINGVYMMIPSSAKNVDMALDLMDHILECELESMDDRSGDLFGYDLEGLKGTTEMSAKYLEAVAAYDAEKIEALEGLGLTDEDKEWAKTVANFYMKVANYTLQMTIPGVDYDIRYADALSVPTATFVAEYGPVHQAQCETFNALYVKQ